MNSKRIQTAKCKKEEYSGYKTATIKGQKC
jgi:hypothetical protein